MGKTMKIMKQSILLNDPWRMPTESYLWPYMAAIVYINVLRKHFENILKYI